MSNGYHVKTLLMSTGERLPVLLTEDGTPVFDATLFALTEVRGRSLATHTISAVLRSVMVLLIFLDFRKIDIDARMAGGMLLTSGEVDDLARFCRRKLTEQCSGEKDATPKVGKVLSLEKVRMTSRSSVNRTEFCGGSNS
jgi:hypothetical protein